MQTLVFTAGLLHLCQLPSMLTAPRMLGWKADLGRLEPVNRRIVLVIGLAIMIVVIGLGVVVMLGARELVGGGALAGALTAFLAVFWLYRGAIQVLVYRRVWPRGALGRLSHYALTTLFFALTGIYFLAFAFNVKS